MRWLELKRLRTAAILLGICGCCIDAEAGGSGLNTVVIINQSSSNSCALGNYFRERRQIPPENVIHINWSGGNISWSTNDFQTTLLTPVLTALNQRHLTNQIDLVVLSMDIPFQTVNGSSVNSTTAALFYGFRNTTGVEWKGITNSYAFSEADFRNHKPASAIGPAFLTTMLTADSLARAKQLVDAGVNSDGTFPKQPIILARSSDPLRNVRFRKFDNALFNTRIQGSVSVSQTDSDNPSAETNIFGYQTGLANFSVAPGTFVPGSIADSLTSFGGVIFGGSGQTSLLAFIQAGASGSYGTVAEPSPDPDKFPDPMVYFYQSRGFSLAESYYQSLFVPYLGLIVGEPLAAPFAHLASGEWLGITPGTVLSGTVPIALQFSSDRAHPLQQIDLFVDGKFFQTLTNVSPLPGNELALNLNRYPITYTNSNHETLESLTAAISRQINSASATNATGIIATAHGDRIELSYAATNWIARPSPPRQLTPTNDSPALNPDRFSTTSAFSVGSFAGNGSSLSTFMRASRNYLMSSTALGRRSFTVSGTIQLGSWLQLNLTKTNGALVSVALTNATVNATPYDLCGTLASLINSTPEFQTGDGVQAEDLVSGWSGSAGFDLLARSPGLAAAKASVVLSGSSNFIISPSGAAQLNGNLSDLLPRNHLYVTIGATNLALTFLLDTAALADGFHELTAVAYEGSSVRTQTHITLPVEIQNAGLRASVTSVDLTNSASATRTFHVQVTANTNQISTIALFSTGGLISSVTNQSSSSFIFVGSRLGAGLHPFYAIVQTQSGERFRTAPLWIRLAD